MKKPFRLFVSILFGTLLSTAAFALSPTSQTARTSPAIANPGKLFDCSNAYGGQPASCEHVPCNKKYQTFLGAWQGEFHAYVRSKSTPDKAVYRPYHNSIRYSASDCMENPKAGESFIVGRQTDRYPAFEGLSAKAANSLLIIGRSAGDKPFLRTVDAHGVNTFALVYHNDAASLSIWTLTLPAAHGNPPMTFTTIDGRNFSAPAAHTRNVTVTMAVGPASAPYWQGVIAYGSHTKQ